MQKRNTFGLLCCLVALCFSGNASAQLAPIKIGIIGPVTGKVSEDMGQSIVGGARAFAADINQMGGILGRQVELVVRDDQAKPEVGVAVSKEVIEQEKVVAAVGFGNTGVALPSAKIFQEAKIPLIVSGATGVAVTKSFLPPAYPASYIFRTSASDELQPIVILNDVIDRRKIDKIAVLHDDSPYGQFGNQNMIAELERRKIKPLMDEVFKVGDLDLSALLKRVRDSGAQAIVIYCLGPDAATIAKEAYKQQLKLPIVGPWGMSQQSFVDNAGRAAEGGRMAVTFIENDLSSVSNEFSLTYRKVNKTNHIPSAVAAAQTYDALRLLALAMIQANSTEGPKVQEALENLQQHTTTTVVTRYYKPFSPTNHEAMTLNMIVMGEIRNGKVVYAYKEDANSGSIARTKQGK